MTSTVTLTFDLYMTFDPKYSRNVVYRVPATGTRSQRIAYRQSLWMAGTWQATGL